MLAFWSIAALLTAGALLFVLPPLLRRQVEAGAPGLASDVLALAVHRERLQELDAARAGGELSADDHARERAELERRVAAELPSGLGATAAASRASVASRWDRWMPWLAAGLTGAVGLGVYARLGQPDALAPPEMQAGADGTPHALTQAQMLALVDRLALRLRSQPDDAGGWHMLARSYVKFARYADASQAYERAAALQPGNAQLLTDYADVLAMTRGRNLDGRPLELIQAALRVDPRHGKALALAGTAAFNRKDYAVAIGHWRTLQSTLPPDSEGFRRVSGSIADAQARLVGDAPPAAAAAAGPAGGTASAPAVTVAQTQIQVGTSIQGEVQVAPALKARIAPGSTLFVFARAVRGPRMPLAIQRMPAAGTTQSFTLDDSQAMSPQTRLSQHAEVTLGARISASGNATPQSGDLMGTLGPVPLGARGVQVVIDGVVP